MEEQGEQTRLPSAPRPQSQSAASAPPPQTRSEPLSPASVPSLRFPNIQVDRRIVALVLSNSAPDMMHTPSVSDAESLTDSNYEFISSADDESQDGRHAESLADSIDMLQSSGDVRSLNGNDAAYDEESSSGEEEDDAEHRSRTHSIRYAEEVLERQSSLSPSLAEQDFMADNAPTPLSHSIEFNEADTAVYLDKISVKHTVRDFGEEETALIADRMNMSDPPKFMAATIRQTMAPHCLSTREPLRLMYVGSEAGRSDITRKISSAIFASAPTNRAGQASGSGNSDGVFNIVPISAFGSTKALQLDDVQLMGVSDYYIKVERCTSAEELTCEGESLPGDVVYSITIDGDKTYTSMCGPSGGRTQPKWALPHIAVFYLSANDSDEDEKTRDAAWEFMTRHAVPSLFISHSMAFVRAPPRGRWRHFVDQGAVHLCLESRDLGTRPVNPERLPIDLNSFLNIDARQMNRNLAYLTGLHEPHEREVLCEADPEDAPTMGFRDRFHQFFKQLADESFSSPNWTRASAVITTALSLCVGLFISGVWLIIYSQAPAYLASLRVTSLSQTSTASCAVPTITPTITISLTSTKTVKLHATEDANVAAQFGGFLSDKAHATIIAENDAAKKMACAIEVYSDHEILVKVPGGTKTSWLAKGAIDIDVWRGKEMLQSKLSTTDAGILIEISKKDAYGVMNVSVVTTRRPKINETFAVDFGSSLIFDAYEAGLGMLQSVTERARRIAGDAAEAAEGQAVKFVAWSDQLKETSKVAHDYSSHLAEEWVNRARDSVNTDNLNNVFQKLQRQATEQLRAADHVLDDMNIVLLRAQIKSRLLWLKAQGKVSQHIDYEAKATEYLLKKTHAVEEKRASKSCGGAGSSFLRQSSSTCKKGCKAKAKGKWAVMG